MRECPMCGELMREMTRERKETIPGTRQTVTRVVREWVCPECDYFEEGDDNQA